MVENLKDELFSQFTKLDILSREDLRERVDEIRIEGLNQQIIEGFYAEYRKSIRNSGQVCTPTIKVIVVGDLHIPYHNKVMVTKLLELLRIEQPDQIILNGDMVDFYDLSRFDKNPEREGRLQEELDICVDLLKSLRKTCKDARIIYIEGNHEDRLKRYLWSKAKALSSLRALKFEELLKFDKYKIEFMKSHFINGFEFNHGNIVRKHSSYSAKCEYDDRGHSGISNHCFDNKTEILTNRGWINGLDLVESLDHVATMNKNTRCLEFQKINKLYTYDNYTELYQIKNNCIDIAVTDKHGLIGVTRHDKLVEFTAEEYYQAPKEVSFILALKNKESLKSNYSDDYLRLLINIVTDGTIHNNAIKWHLKKQRKIDNLKGILDRLNYKYNVNLQKGGTTVIYLPTDYSTEIINRHFCSGKVLPDFFRHMTDKANLILNEYSITDGCKNKLANNSYQLVSAKEKEIDILQELFAKSGFRTSKIVHNNVFVLTVNTRNTARINKKNISKIPYTGKVWCVNVDNGTLLIRRNGKTVVTQNTHRGGSYYKTISDGTFGWFENFCGCELNPEYIEGTPNWQTGFSVIYFDDNAFDVHQVYVNRGRFRFNGTRY